MGMCNSVIPQARNIDIIHELDKNIILAHSFMKNKSNSDQIKNYFSSLLYYQLIEEKSDEIKTKRFYKWIDMSTSSEKLLYSVDTNQIINSLERQKKEKKYRDEKVGEEHNINKIFFKNKRISYTENGLRYYYNKNKTTFENRILKGPPGIFRWISWIIISNLPDKRPHLYYEKLVNNKITKNKKIEILSTIEDTIEEKGFMVNEIKASLFRLLKALSIIDHEIIFIKGITYILGYLLIISNNDELNIYYFMISLLSKTFSDKFGIRSFYTQDQTLLVACNSIFKKYLKKYFPELSEHFAKIKLPFYSWILLWIQMIYINVFPNYLVLRIWDHFLIHGISFLLSLGLSIVEYFYEDLINCSSNEEILEFFKKLNPNLKSSYKKIETLDYNIEELISNALKKFPITNEEIYIKLKKFPNYNNNYIYIYKDKNKNKKNIIRKSKSLKEQTNDTLSYSLDTNSEEIEQNNNTGNLNSSSLCSLSNNTYNILEENINENITLSISQNNGFSELYYEDDSCEEIEDEDIYIDEHIKDLMKKQTCFNRKFNLTK